MPESLLKLDAVNSFYGPVQVHFDLTLSVERGHIVCLLGGNASGKSTTMKTILGLQKPRSGKVWFDGADITGLPTPQIIRRGIGSVPEARRLFGAMTVRENLLMGAYIRSDKDAIAQDEERVLTLFPRLRERLRQRAGTMSGGEQQMCAIGRALMSSPRILLLDEPSAGLAPLVVAQVFELVKRIRDEGLTVLIVEQNVAQVLRVVDRAYVLDAGRVVAEGASAALAADPAIRNSYLGGH